MKKIRMLGKYLYQYRYGIGMFLLFSFIFGGIFFLYNIETEAVLYAGGLCLLIILILFPLHFYSFCKKHEEREYLLKNILIMTEKLPQPDTLGEKDYQEIIKFLREENGDNRTKYQKERAETLDYYTTWVHQIKIPISVMRMILKEDTKEHQELLAELFRIEQYVEMVLCYFRLDSSSSDFVFKRYKLDDIIKKAIHKFAPQFVKKHIQLQYEPTDIIVLTDEKWLLFIIEQFLSNSIKYTEKGKVTIKVTSDKLLSISDTGMGISPEDIPRIFEKGFTGYNGRAGEKSTGLGLYLSKKAADKLSHGIKVESQVGKGSTFYVDLQEKKLETE